MKSFLNLLLLPLPPPQVLIITSCHRPFLPGTSPLEPLVILSLRLQVAECSTFHIMCRVSHIAVFCSKSTKSGISSKISFKPFSTILMAPVITGMIIHFMFHFHCTLIHKLLYLVSASFCLTFLSTWITTSISMHPFSFFGFYYYSCPICHNFSSGVLLLLLLLHCRLHKSGETGIWLYDIFCTSVSSQTKIKTISLLDYVFTLRKFGYKSTRLVALQVSATEK